MNYIPARYALRLVGTHPFVNPASARQPINSLIHWDHKPPKRIFPFKHRNAVYRPRSWNSKSKNHTTTHLPIDKVLSKLVPLTSLNKLMPRYYKATLPSGIDGPNLHKDCLTPNQTNDFLLKTMFEEWSNLYLNATYKYPIPRKPHTFMRLGKF
jgi:hypothetical protein